LARRATRARALDAELALLPAVDVIGWRRTIGGDGRDDDTAYGLPGFAPLGMGARYLNRRAGVPDAPDADRDLAHRTGDRGDDLRIAVVSAARYGGLCGAPGREAFGVRHSSRRAAIERASLADPRPTIRTRNPRVDAEVALDLVAHKRSKTRVMPILT
jgi:hypothetical protein